MPPVAMFLGHTTVPVFLEKPETVSESAVTLMNVFTTCILVMEMQTAQIVSGRIIVRVVKDTKEME